MKGRLRNILIIIMSLLLMFSLYVNSSALSFSDESSDLLGRKSILLTVDTDKKDYYSDINNLISIINDNTSLYGDLCYRKANIIYGASEESDSDAAIILLDLTIYGTSNIEAIKSAFIQCEGVRFVESDGTVHVNTDFTKGDVDCNGLITAADARIALRKSVGLEKELNKLQIGLCDIDENGIVTSSDARSILLMSIGVHK